LQPHWEDHAAWPWVCLPTFQPWSLGQFPFHLHCKCQEIQGTDIIENTTPCERG
jgi:hypothetical protein